MGIKENENYLFGNLDEVFAGVINLKYGNFNKEFAELLGTTQPDYQMFKDLARAGFAEAMTSGKIDMKKFRANATVTEILQQLSPEESKILREAVIRRCETGTISLMLLYKKEMESAQKK